MPEFGAPQIYFRLPLANSFTQAQNASMPTPDDLEAAMNNLDYPHLYLYVALGAAAFMALAFWLAR